MFYFTYSMKYQPEDGRVGFGIVKYEIAKTQYVSRTLFGTTKRNGNIYDKDGVSNGEGGRRNTDRPLMSK